MGHAQLLSFQYQIMARVVLNGKQKGIVVWHTTPSRDWLMARVVCSCGGMVAMTVLATNGNQSVANHCWLAANCQRLAFMR